MKKKNAYTPDSSEFTLNLSFYKTLKKHKDILEDIIKIFKQNPFRKLKLKQ